MGFETKSDQKEQSEQQIEGMKDKIEQNRQEYVKNSEKRDENDVRRPINFAELSGKRDLNKSSHYSTINMQKSKSNDKSM